MKAKMIQLSFVSLLLASFCFGIALFSTSAPQAHAATLQSQPTHTTSTNPALQQPTWITKADPYVHVTQGYAVIDSGISSVLISRQVAQVKASVQHYNQLPLSPRLHPVISAHASSVSPQWSWCNPGWAKIQWWGTQYYLTSCGVNEVLAGSSLFTLFGPIATGVVVVNDFFVWMASINSCNGSIYIDINWFGMPAYVPACENR